MEKAIVAFHDYLYYVAYYLLIVYYNLSYELFLDLQHYFGQIVKLHF